jgi:hypothetical protein
MSRPQDNRIAEVAAAHLELLIPSVVIPRFLDHAYPPDVFIIVVVAPNDKAVDVDLLREGRCSRFDAVEGVKSSSGAGGTSPSRAQSGLFRALSAEADLHETVPVNAAPKIEGTG